MNQSNGTRSRKHDLTMTPHFIGRGQGQTIVGVNVKTTVRAIESQGWTRVKGRPTRYRLAGQSRCVFRFFQGKGKGRQYATAVFALGELRPETAVAA